MGKVSRKTLLGNKKEDKKLFSIDNHYSKNQIKDSQTKQNGREKWKDFQIQKQYAPKKLKKNHWQQQRLKHAINDLCVAAAAAIFILLIPAAAAWLIWKCAPKTKPKERERETK